MPLWLQGQIGMFIKARNKCNNLFSYNFTGQSISEIILLIQGHLQGQKVNFKENIIFQQIKLIMCVRPPFHGILTEKFKL